MPFESGPQPTTIYVNDNFLPYPATKLIITQYLKAVPSQPWWAWIVVGAFLDVDDNIIWSTEVFVAHLDVELEPESDEEADDDSADEALDAPQGSRPSSPTPLFQIPAVSAGSPSQQPAREPSHRPNVGPRLPPTRASPAPGPGPFPVQPAFAHGFWNPTSYTPAHGHWIAAFDPTTSRWVNTWQSHH